VDVRYVDRFDIALLPQVASPLPPTGPGPNLDIAPVVPSPSLTVTDVPPTYVPSPERRRFVDRYIEHWTAPDGRYYEISRPVLTVKAIDPGVTLHLTRLTGSHEERDEKPNSPIVLAEGVWRVEIRIGRDVIGIFEDNFASGGEYVLEAKAQVTPALAALLENPGPEAELAASNPRPDLIPSESIGPMQGAILPTLLPLLALKPLDHNNQLLSSFSPRLHIPPLVQQSPVPLMMALAFDGAWNDAELRGLATTAMLESGVPAKLIWHDDSQRVSLFVIDHVERKDLVTLNIPNRGSTSVVVSRLHNYATTVTMILWPDGRNDVSVSVFALPPGVDQVVRPTRLSRAMAIATRLYRDGRSLDDVEYDVFTMISSGSYGNPVLGALAWFARAQKLRSDPSVTLQVRQDLTARQDGIRNFLTATVPQLGDTRVIAALSSPAPDIMIDALLADPNMTNPILAEPLAILARRAIAREQLDHWSVNRFQRLPTDAVFNVTTRRATPGS
jgi:hypothetical protein